MKRIILSVALLLICSVPAYATPPSKIEADYVKADGKLYVYMDHTSRNHYRHYIRMTEISINGSLVATVPNRQQIDPAHYGFAVNLNPKPNDTVSIKAYSSQGGTKEVSIVIPEDKKDKDKKKAPAPESKVKKEVETYLNRRTDIKKMYGSKTAVYGDETQPTSGTQLKVYGSKANAMIGQ